MTILETFSLRNQQIALAMINGFPVVLNQDGKEIKWYTAVCLAQAVDLYSFCIERLMERERKN